MDIGADIGSILGVIGSAASGGILGLFGTGVKLWADHKAEQAKRTFELAMRKADRDEMQLEHDLQMKQIEAQTNRDIAIAEQHRLTSEIQVAGEVELSELAMRRESYGNDKATYGGGFVDGIRGLMRPALTLYFAVLMSIIAMQLMQVNETIWQDKALAQAMYVDVINAIIFLTTTAVTWWFGSRPIKRG